MQHDDVARKDLFQVMEAFSKVKDAVGQMAGPAFKTMKSEFVTWQEAISAKKYDLYDENQRDQPEGAFTQRNMNRSQQSWVKTFMQDAMDEKGQALFDNLAWFAKKLCSVMTSVSASEHMWIIEGRIHNKHRNRLVSQMWRKLFVPMATSSSGRIFSYPDSRKSHGTRRHVSVNRTDIQTSKVWTIQMMMTLILTPALRVKTNTD